MEKIYFISGHRDITGKEFNEWYFLYYQRLFSLMKIFIL